MNGTWTAPMKDRKRRCAEKTCGKVFTRNTPNQKYCNRKCALKSCHRKRYAKPDSRGWGGKGNYKIVK
jgi:hypothetical protein